MEIFGSTFDDSVFLEARDRVSVSLSSYNAKICEPQWFCDEAALDTDDSLEKQKVWKFRGDLALRQGHYQKSFAAYSTCLQLISDNNLTIKRDVLEGMARCCIRLGQKDKALDLAQLLVSIYRYFGTIGATISSLQELCSLLPFNPWHWLDLGQTCVQLLRSDRTVEDQTNADTEEQVADVTEERVWLKACTCFIRSRLLLRIFQQQQSSFVLQRSEKALQETDEALQRLNPTESTLRTLTEVMSEDLIPERMREDYQDGESLASVCVQSYRERWWNRILQIGVLDTEQLIKTNTKS